MKVKLNKIFRNDNIPGGTRTEEVIGECECLPEVGYPFIMWAEPLEFGNIRFISTSRVLDVESIDKLHVVSTMSGSVYHVEVLD